MKSIRDSISRLFIIGGLIAVLSPLHAQTTTIAIHSTSANSLNAMLEVVEATTPLAATDVPPIGTFYSAQNLDFPPMPCNINNLDAWDLGNDVYLLDDLDFDYATAQTESLAAGGGMLAMDDSGPPSPGDGGGGTNSLDAGSFSPSYSFDTNGLWLQITNVSNGLAYLNLNNATDSVYAIWSTTNLLAAWNVETEMWPTNPAVMPFAVSILERQNLFMQAEDWTGVTENGNTTPDWWFWEYFGTVALSDSDLDSTGTNTLLYDYTNSLDPNVIQFTLSTAGHFINTPTAPVQINVFAGVPSYYAVLVNDTNLADANWQAYRGTNITVNLGSTDEVYTVSVGLRGLPPNATATWQTVQLILDTVAPTIIITNPAAGTVSQPMIQVQGYANEALSSLTFDVSNAAGLWTNQTGYITSRYYDLNLLDFTTNWFQCYDIALTNGLNTVTLHATDLAGNVTTTNFSFTLDYSNATNPPVLTVIWPQDGTAIGGSSFTLQAQVDDNTATVTAQIVDANGDTNTVQGLVERSGLVWIQNLPLGDGENALTVVATDAAGNTTTTNFNVVQNDVGLTMNPLSGGQLNQNTVNVTGTIGNINYVVTVNGVQANVNADGSWEADGVPVSSIGTAVLDVEVYSGMTSNSSMRPMDANSDNSVASDVHEQPQPPLAIASGCGAVGNCEWTNANTWGQSNGVMDETIAWDFTWGGTYDYSSSFADGGPSVWGSAFLFNGGPVEASWFSPAYEYSALNDRMVQTKVMIVPQGMVQLATTPATQSYLVCACAAEVSPPFLPFDEQNLNSTGGYNYDWMFDLCGLCVGNVPLPLQWLQVQGQTLTPTTNTDGSVWGITVVSAPAGATVDVTPTLVPGVTLTNNDYTFNVQAGGMQIVDVNTGTILTGQTNTVIVGQQVNLKCQLMVSNEVITVFPLANFQWTVPGYAILNYVVAADSSSAMVVTNFPLNNSNVVFYWVDGANNRIIQCSAMAQGKTFTAQAMFNVYRPQLIQFNPMPPYTPVINNGWLELGNDQTYVGTMNFNAIVQSKTDYPQGVVNWTQLVNRNVTGISLATSTSGQYWLDTSRLYNTDTNNNPVNTSIDPRNGIIFYDNPGVGSIGGYLSITDSFQTYLVFNPDPNNASSIWVTLGVVNWGWSATESSWSLTSSNVVAPTYTNSVSLPTWAHILQGKGQ